MGGVYQTPAIPPYPILSQADPAIPRMRRKTTTNQNVNGINAHYFSFD